MYNTDNRHFWHFNTKGLLLILKSEPEYFAHIFNSVVTLCPA